MVKNMKKIIGFLCCLVFCTSMAVGVPQMARAAEVAVDETNFPDSVFRDYVSSKFDTDSNGKLSEEEIAGAKSISVYFGGIRNLKGIEHFTALINLDCYYNQLSSLDVSQNTALRKLSCYNNQLSSLDVSHNTALQELSCSSNQLSNLDVSRNTALQELSCSSNQLSSLDVSQNMALTRLEFSSNQLSSLDISQITALQVLDCDNNQLSSLDVSRNTTLISLYCSSNQLSSLDVSRNTALQELYCSSNQLSNLDVSHNTALQELDCSSNQLSNLDVGHNTALINLYCSSNQLSNLDVGHNTALINLYCSSNQLSSLDVSQNIALTRLKFSSNQLSSLDVSQNTALIHLNCSSNSLMELKLNSQTYDTLSLYKRYLHGINVSLTDLQNVTETRTNNADTVSLIKVTDITKLATYKVDGKDFTIIYTDTLITQSPEPSGIPSATPMQSLEPSTSPAVPSALPSPSAIPTQLPSPVPTSLPNVSTSPVVPSDAHIFSDYNYNSPMTSDVPVIYGNGISKKIDGKKVNNKALTVYTDILASYKYTPNSNNSTVKASVGKVIVTVTKDNVKPTVNDKNKVTSTVASKVAKAKIKNGQITVTTVGKEGGLVYLWVIDTGSKGVSACCPIDVKLAPKKLEVQNTSGSKIAKNTKLANGNTLDVCVAGLVGTTKTDDGIYTAEVASKYQGYVSVTPVDGSKNKFTITAKGLKNNKDTKVAVTFKCDQNGKKTNLSLTITK